MVTKYFDYEQIHKILLQLQHRIFMWLNATSVSLLGLYLSIIILHSSYKIHSF